MAVTADAVPRGTVTAKLRFTQPPVNGAVPFNYVDAPPAGEPQSNLETYEQAVTITDIRGRETEFDLERDAFQVIQNVAPSSEPSFTNDESIKKNYYPEVEKLLLENIPGSNRVFFFDHTIRRADPDAPRKAVMQVHIDQTAYSAEKRVRRHMGEEAERLLRGRYRIVNVWRPLNQKPVEATPLAFASSSTLAPRDVLPVEHRYPHGYVGQTAAINHSPEQEFHYLSGMTGGERLLLECFDSESLREGPESRKGRVAHTAFEDPRTRPGAEGRDSIEVRALVFGP